MEAARGVVVACDAEEFITRIVTPARLFDKEINGGGKR